MAKSEIRMDGGVPALFADGVKIPAAAYITYRTEKACYEDFAAVGCRLYSVPIFFAERTINEISQLEPFVKGIFEQKGKPDFSIADREFEKILAACPDALIFPRVNLSMPLWWEAENPDELLYEGRTEHHRPCFSSDKWAEDTKELLGALIAHIRQAPYAEHIIGYQLAGGNTEEWFPFDMKGSLGKRTDEKFAAYQKEPGIAGTEAEFYAFLSHTVAARIAEFAAFAKKCENHEQVIGTFYGYTFECPDRNLCHHALGELLESPDVDFFCSPASYMDQRVRCFDTPYMLPLHSLVLHGKLYFIENDVRTHLTTPPNKNPHYNTEVWQPKDKGDTIELLKLQFARALTHDHALWWFDMWGGWYRDDDYLALFRKFFALNREALAKPGKSLARCAVFIDERALSHLTDQNGAERMLGYCYRKTLGLMGVPYDIYLASDYEAVRDHYDAHIVFCQKMTPLLKTILADTPERKQIITAEHQPTAKELRDFCIGCGVPIYTEEDAVIFANESYLFVYTHTRGTLHLHLPKNLRLKPILGDWDGITETELPVGCGYLFELQEEKETTT
ncbi:MAG: hypothetical protein MJ175_06645 [Clostridia bacterium]|nr:hypothetical protein [Clostridia bacterium]